MGRKILLSVRGSSVTSVGGNLGYGKPGVSPQPFGVYFGEDVGKADGGGLEPRWRLPNSTHKLPHPHPHPGVVPMPTMYKPHPNLFDPTHPPSSFALTLSSLFGTTHTERADLRPLGPEPGVDPITWVARPLGDEVVVDGFDVQIPGEWRGTVQGGLFLDFVRRLKEVRDEGKGREVVLMGWV